MEVDRGPRLVVVPTPIGNLDDISKRSIRALSEADVIFAEDTRSARRLLTALEIPAPELTALFEGNEKREAAQVVAAISDDKVVALISEAGMPGVSDPGFAVIEHVRSVGLLVEVLPGPVAAIVALVGSGLPTQPFSFYGFLPREGAARRQMLGGLSGRSETLVFYESPRRVSATLGDMAEAFGAERRGVLARELTKMHEEYTQGTLEDLAASFEKEPPRGECTLIVEGRQGEEPKSISDEALEAAVLEMLAEGESPKIIAGRLMVRTGKSRRDLYQLALALSRTTEK